MAQKVKVRKIESVKDTVIFMTAYQFHDVNKRMKFLTMSKKNKDLMKQHHISSLSTDNAISSQFGKFELSMLHNYVTQQSEFDIKPKEKKNSKALENGLKELNWVIPLRHAETLLLGEDGLSISFCINMESFLVRLNEEVLQVDPVIFALKSTLVIAYELIHYDSGIPFSSGEIYGRNCNYNILPVTGLRYFDDSDFSVDERSISDIIFENVKLFVEKVLKKYRFGSHSYVHNIFVRSNNLDDIEEYFQMVIGAEIPELHVQDISPQSQFNYFATEFLGVVCNINCGDSDHVLFECLLLEAMKMYLCLEMIVEYDVTNKLSDLLNRRIYLEHYYYPSGAPIITHNAIDNIRQTITYKRYEQAIHFKIEAMKDMQDRKRIKNGIFLNVLLYILAALGGLQAVEILENHIGLPFSLGFAVELVLFGGLGLLWYYNEKKE